MQMDEITEEMGIDLQTESLLVRGEQLARLESDKLVDKVQGREMEYFSLSREFRGIRVPIRSNLSNLLPLCVFFAFVRKLFRSSTPPPCRGFGASDPSTPFFPP